MTVMRRISIFLAIILVGILLLITLKTPGGLPGFWVMFSSAFALNKVEIDNDLDVTFTLPPGFNIQLFAENLDYPRFMQITQQQNLIVSLPDSGNIIILKDLDEDEKAETVEVLITNLDNPQGIVLYNDWLYFSERDKISRVRFNHQTGTLAGNPEILIPDLPYRHPSWTHNVKPIGISPSGKLHINIGSPCNTCEPDDSRYSAMHIANLDGTNLEIHATGLRNSIAFDWAPWSGELYATDNGSDFLGDDFPPDELNRIIKSGFYGWPYLHGKNVPDPKYGVNNPLPISAAIPPAFEIPAHNAPLGIHFIRQADDLPAAYNHSALVALHGSWNRSEPDGYKVISLHWTKGGTIESLDFLSGFLTPKGVIGRPVDVKQRADGSFYISDDLGGRIYLVKFSRE